ncbi:DNA helicase [Tanacetum coccineum]
MNDRRCFETLDRTLRDLLDEPNNLFGGKTVMLGGDFRQTLLGKKSAPRDEIIRSSVANSYIWRHLKVHYLTKNMRLNNEHLREVDREKVSTFAQWLLDVGNGHIGMQDESDLENTSWINIPDDYCIPDDKNGISNLIKFIYDDETLHNPSTVKLQDKASVCPKNDMADVINAKVLSMLSGRTHTYISFDDAIPHGYDGGEVELLNMATTSNINKAREDKGKMIIAEPEITNIVDLRPIHSNKIIEAIVYRKWTYKHIHTRQPTKYSCMLIDEQGAPIQENIDVKDADYFD